MKRMVLRPTLVSLVSVALIGATVTPAMALPQLRIKEIISPATVSVNGKIVVATFRYSCATDFTAGSVSASQSRGSDGYGVGVTSIPNPRCDGGVRRLKVSVPISEGVVKPGHVDILVSMSGFLDDEIISSSLGETIDVIRR